MSTPYAHVVWKLNPFSISFDNDITSQSFNPLDDLQSVDINIPNFSDHEFVDLLLCGSPNFNSNQNNKILSSSISFIVKLEIDLVAHFCKMD